ncbi:hypothetical protein K435DRAFT_787658 [Dendrothele bispora CBS 962.96]|uniref:Uncharacterized protein n=1 Tax=Dendrothele bispora (strain CBS 962.96) TaxID=1314807 RepID=A0A4S8MZC2_DENBC|nr:hypothetical protein K435DRAFT_787658 [Dendrothele bispora CBS 962.96]
MRSSVQNLVIFVGAMQYEPVAPMLPDQEPKLMTTTVRDYDLSDVSKLPCRDYIGITMIAFLHGYMTFTQPSPHPISYESQKLVRPVKPVRLQALGQKAGGDLKGPWKAGGGMFVVLTFSSSELSESRLSKCRPHEIGSGFT